MEASMRMIAVCIGALMFAAAAVAAEPGAETMKFAVVRNGTQIGTHTIELRRSGPEILVNQSTQIVVKVLFVTAYHFEQTESERWSNNHLAAMESVANDNGTEHKFTVRLKGTVLMVDGDGKTNQVSTTTLPASLWNVALVKQTTVLNPRDGSVMQITVTDMGIDNLVVRGQPTKARHYEIKGPFTQYVWYDDKGNLVQAKFIGSDNSDIFWQLT
jgi:Family of unknown function (DUF6134)